ncbi:MAG: alpha/beta hydrolase [Proteobacteria bacterium]|nr:alpha/beta hydrolase [Pseudomonadota bacterium]
MSREPEPAPLAGRPRPWKPAALLGLLVFGLYLAVVAVFYLNQRSFLYPRTSTRTAPGAAGLEGFVEVTLPTGDGETLVGWWRPPPAGAGAVLYYHGNGGSLVQRRDRFEDMAEAGLGVLAVSYRGYNGSTGTPSERALIADAEAALDWLGARAPAERTAVFGESLGSGVAVALAAKRQVGGLVLDSAYASVERTAARLYPFLPVRWLASDRYNSEARIRRVQEPVLIAHCEDDRMIPLSEARRLHSRAPGPRTLMILPRCGHVQTWEAGGRARMLGALLAFTSGAP